MLDELVPVVDLNDNIIEYKPRSVVHNPANLLLHRVIHVVVFNSKGEFLLQKRSLEKEQFPGLWTSSASGHIAKGQTPKEAAIRELEEEVGLVDVRLEFVDKFILETDVDREFSWVYKTISDDTIEKDGVEVEEVKFFNRETILEIKNDLTPFGKEVLKLLKLL